LVQRTFSAIGGPAARSVLVSLILLGLLVRRRPRSAALLLTATGGMGIINTSIKELVRRQRPEVLPGFKQAGGYSFPSGHSSGSLVFFGAVGYLIWHLTRHRVVATTAFSLGSVLTGLVGRSRVSLRAHHGSDVLAGYALGALWLGLVLKLFAGPLAAESRGARR